MSIHEVLSLAIPTLLTAIVIPLLIGIGNAVKNYVKAKTDNAKLDKYIDQANDAIITAVAEVMQTFVTTMKNSGQWNEENARKAFELAKYKAIEIMGAEALNILPAVVGDFQAWLTAKIEAATLEAKAFTQTRYSLDEDMEAFDGEG